MEIDKVLHYIDHTQLKPFSTWDDIKKLCDEAIKYKTATVCVPPCYIKKIKESYKNDISVCTVVGFPLGYSLTEVKALETSLALEDGADEIDMVINISDVKNGNFENIKNEISTLKSICGEKVLKVIIETCYLTDKEKINLCNIITEVKADYIKTSTGFGTNGATLEDVILFRNNVGKDVKIKAAGGVKTVLDMQNFIKEGCSRIGTSSAIDIINGNSNSGY